MLESTRNVIFKKQENLLNYLIIPLASEVSYFHLEAMSQPWCIRELYPDDVIFYATEVVLSMRQTQGRLQ